MKLYKYYPPEAVDYLFSEDGLCLRFSQPEILNDPFELTYSIKDSNVILETLIKLEDLIKQLETENLDKEGSETLNKAKKQHEYSKTYIEELRHLQNDRMLILSLSENENSRPMWAHYSKDHTGFLIEIDIRKLPSKLLAEEYNINNPDKKFLGKVTYSNKRLDTESIKDETEFAFIKDDVWKYESEYRVISFKSLLKKVNIDKNDMDIYIDILGYTGLSKVIVGARSNDALLEKLKLWRDKYKSEFIIQKAVLDTEFYRLNYQDLD